MEPLLQIRDLVVHFNTDRGVVQALHEANLTIRRGEVVALVGEKRMWQNHHLPIHSKYHSLSAGQNRQRRGILQGTQHPGFE